MKVSVIVPVYNVEKYLKKCLDSLVNQTLNDIEVLVINDGSPDNSQLIIDEYVAKYPKLIKSYIKKNGGLSDARNYGIKKATGKYIAFLDSDDSVQDDMYEKLYSKALEHDFDVVACGLLQVYETEKESEYVSPNIKKDLFSKDEIKEMLYEIYPSAWNKLYKRELLSEKYFFKKGVYFEDVEFSYRFFTQVNSVGVINEPLIFYLKREGAITSIFDNRLYHYIDNWNGIITFYHDNDLYNNYKEMLEYAYVRYLYAVFIKGAAGFSDKKEYKKAYQAAKKNVHEKFPHYRRNKYFYKSLKGIYLLTFNRLYAIIIYRFINK